MINSSNRYQLQLQKFDESSLLRILLNIKMNSVASFSNLDLSTSNLSLPPDSINLKNNRHTFDSFLQTFIR